MSDSLKLLVRGLADFLLPPQCPLCSRPNDPSDPHTFCPSCFSDVTFITAPYCIKCGTPFASPHDESHLCGRCLTRVTAYARARAVCVFSGSIKRAIHVFKYEGKTYLDKTLVGLMERSPLQFRIERYDALLPVPLHPIRLKRRGYNQSLLLAREVARRYSVPVAQGMLKRTRDSIPQVELSGRTREENVKGIFSIEGDPTEKTLLLIDDVLTTGATAHECARTLLRGGAKRVDVLAIARAV